jgi:hypothetical protein
VRLEGLGQWKKSSNFIGNRTSYLSACSIVPQLTTLPRVPVKRNEVLETLFTRRIYKIHNIKEDNTFVCTLLCGSNP